MSAVHQSEDGCVKLYWARREAYESVSVSNDFSWTELNGDRAPKGIVAPAFYVETRTYRTVLVIAILAEYFSSSCCIDTAQRLHNW